MRLVPVGDAERLDREACVTVAETVAEGARAAPASDVDVERLRGLVVEHRGDDGRAGGQCRVDVECATQVDAQQSLGHGIGREVLEGGRLVVLGDEHLTAPQRDDARAGVLRELLEQTRPLPRQVVAVDAVARQRQLSGE